MSVSKQSAFSTAQKHIKLFPCIICKKPTDQTCSLCRKVFYCSAQHQQIDWHMKHKSQCEGKIVQFTKSQSGQSGIMGQFETGESTMVKTLLHHPSTQIQQRSVQVRIQNESRQWMKVFQQRLIMRRKCLDNYQKLLEHNNKQTTNKKQELNLFEEQLKQLTIFSESLLANFKPQFTPILEESFGMTSSVFILELDHLLDLVLINKFYSLIQRHEEVRKFLLTVEQYLPIYEGENKFREVYGNCLKALLELSEKYLNDRVSEWVMSKYILMVEKFQGIMQRIYAYMNMGLWYMSKTYFHKAIKCFTYSLQLIQSHSVKFKESDSFLLIRSNILFNLSLCEYETNNEQSAFSNMQQSYRLRVKSLGKNAIESSNCLYTLSLWTFQSKEWQDTLQYAKQCYRVRKLNKDNYIEELTSIERLLQQIYQHLKSERQRNIQEMNTKNIKYYDTLLPSNMIVGQQKDKQQIMRQKQPNLEPQQSFIKQLNSSVRPELMQFKLIITPEMAETYSSKQWEKLTKLLEIDKMIEKQEIRRIIFQSQFTESLNQSQRDAFIKANLIE